ncbi:uncharacterized protein LOC123556558 [Mercenaria mercenaria]|uniref:uncharacterized protein LOC123556558 n=1 Tax=Mercenaria mercenaria TaxID=6596 RepID=UPI00234F41DD|nr:uncharacterized protein LOC123556558 [Mercenaria mercenaria]
MGEINFILCLFVYSNILFSTQFVHSSVTQIKCSASDNVRWNKFKKECVICPDCPPGTFRNFTEPYTRRTGIHGDEQCLQCRPCPDGKYSENGVGECIKCRMNCTEMNREYDELCSSVQDAKCGSCLYGFEDTYRHTLFPCSPKKSLRLLEPSEDKANQLQNLPDKQTSKREQAVEVRAHTGENTDKVPGETIAIVTISVALILIVTVTTLILKRNRSLARQGIYSNVNILCDDPDVETDAGHQDHTIQKSQYLNQMTGNAVRPELSAAVQPLVVRPELSQPANTGQFDGMIRTLRLSDGSLVSFQLKKDFCDCRVNKQCFCEKYTFPVCTLDKSHEYITVVATEVCHDPFPLFRKLGLKNSILYQENNTRDRDPENITQKELVTRLLNIWVEIKSSEATLYQLSQALCKADFHNINMTLYNLSNKSINNSSPS